MIRRALTQRGTDAGILINSFCLMDVIWIQSRLEGAWVSQIGRARSFGPVSSVVGARQQVLF